MSETKVLDSPQTTLGAAAEVTTASGGSTTRVVRSAPRQAAPPPVARLPRPVGGRTLDDRASVIGAGLGSLALTWVIYEQMLALGGYVGFVISWWLVFIALYAAVTSLSHPHTVVSDRLVAVVVASGAALVGLALAATVVFVVVKGWPALHHLNFYTEDMSTTGPSDPLTNGGISHALLGSFMMVSIATLLAMPLGLGTAIYMSEVGGKFSRVVRTVVEAMTGLPDIVAGLFIYTFLITELHWERTGFTGALALSVTAVPIIARAGDVTLRVVPGGLREASFALGSSQWQTVRRVVLPTARAGLATALILSVARVAGESAPLLIVSTDTNYFNANPFHGPMNSLPLFIIQRVRSGQPGFIARGFGAAAVLLAIVLILFAGARFLARDKTGHR